MQPLSQKIIDASKRKLTDHNQKVFQLAFINTNTELMNKLNQAIDEDDMTQVNLLLDALQAQHRATRLLQALPPRVVQEINQYEPPVRQFNGDKDNTEGRH